MTDTAFSADRLDELRNLANRLAEITPEARNLALTIFNTFLDGMITQEQLVRPST